MVIIGLAYLFVGLQKLRYSGLDWVTSDNLRYVLWASSDAQADPNGLALLVADHALLAHLFAAATLVVEVGFILCLPFARLRWLLVPAAIGLHVGHLDGHGPRLPAPGLGRPRGLRRLGMAGRPSTRKVARGRSAAATGVERMTSEAFEIRLGDPAAPESRDLVGAMEREIEELYADRPGSIHSVPADPEAMTPPAGTFVLVHAGDRPVGCGGFKRLDAETCEIKRMYLRPEVRGLGLSGRLLAALEERAAAAGYMRVRLDTGDRQPAAMHLYARSGYREIEDYNGNTAATHWFEKELAPAPQPRR